MWSYFFPENTSFDNAINLIKQYPIKSNHYISSTHMQCAIGFINFLRTETEQFNEKAEALAAATINLICFDGANHEMNANEGKYQHLFTLPIVSSTIGVDFTIVQSAKAKLAVYLKEFMESYLLHDCADKLLSHTGYVSDMKDDYSVKVGGAVLYCNHEALYKQLQHAQHRHIKITAFYDQYFNIIVHVIYKEKPSGIRSMIKKKTIYLNKVYLLTHDL